MKSKNGKSPGVDEIPYEVLKYDCVLHRLFMLCFESHIIPSVCVQLLYVLFLKILTVIQEYRFTIEESVYYQLFIKCTALF